MRRCLFLDIDGVLNSTRFLEESARGEGVRILDGQLDGTHHLDPVRVAKLDDFVERHGLELVLSSSWRILFGLDRTEQMLRSVGFRASFVGETPNLRDLPRAREVAAFLASAEGRDVATFAILDDDPTAGDELAAHLVLVDDGLLDEDLARAATILGVSPS
jgi:hypothetical protein